MKLSAVGLNRLEGIGLILILFSFFIQIFQNNSEESFRESQNYHLNKKLDHLWVFIKKEYADGHLKKKDSLMLNSKSTNDDWEAYSSQAKELKTWEGKIEFFADISTWIFVLGTILVILPKFIPEKSE